MGGAVPKEVEVCLVHVMCYACVDRLCTRAAYICRIHRSLQVSCYHGVARNWGAALPRCGCMPVCGVSILFRLNIYFGGIARLEHQISPRSHTVPFPPLSPVNKPPARWRGSAESLGFPFSFTTYVFRPLIGLIHAAVSTAVE